MVNAVGYFSREMHVYIETGLSEKLNHRRRRGSDLWPDGLGVRSRFIDPSVGVFGKRFRSGS
jgi:hypothetical protein